MTALMIGFSLAQLEAQETGVVTGHRVNVRGQPSLAGEVVTQLKEGETVAILEEINLENPKKDEPARWYRIELPANTPVWVHGSFIDPATKIVLPRRLNMRAGPGENYSILGRLEKGDVVSEIRQKENWLEIQAPTNAVAFIAADLVARAETPAPAIAPVEKPAEPPPAVPMPAPPAEPPPIIETPPPQPVTVAPPVETPPPAPLAAPEVQPPAKPAAERSPSPRRVVRREGVVKPTVSVQAPTYYQLDSVDSGKTIAYLYTTSTNLVLKDLKGRRIFVTGEELVDKRWENAPVLEIDSIELIP